MNLAKFWPAFNLAQWAIGIAAILAVCGGLWWFVSSGDRARQDAARAHAGQIIAEGHTAASVDAVGVVQDHADTTAATVAIQEGNNNAIQSAEGAKAPVNPALAGTALRGLCKYAAYHSDPECVRLAHSGTVAPTR